MKLDEARSNDKDQPTGGMSAVTNVPGLVARVTDELARCNRCGFCQTRCPVYRITGRESSVARGHLSRMQAAVSGEIPFDDGIRESLFECLMCRACTAECPPAIKTDRAVFAARASYVAQRQPVFQRAIFRVLLGNPLLLRTGVRILGWLKRTRITALAGLLRILPWLDRGYSEAPGWLPTPKTFLRQRIARRTSPEVRSGKVAYFVGCAIDYAFPDIGESTLDVLDAAGYQVSVVPNVCCGLPPYSYGDLESARALARKNIKALQSTGSETIITDCASCSSFLRDYPELFEKDDPMRAAAGEVAGRVKELSQFLAESSISTQLQPVDAALTYHDPCHLSRYQEVTSEPRDLLRCMPGVEYLEMPEADWCCGGAGSYAVSHYEMSMKILDRKMENIRRTGARVVVTLCPACIMQLRYGAETFGVPVEVVHLSEMLRRALPLAPTAGGKKAL